MAKKAVAKKAVAKKAVAKKAVAKKAVAKKAVAKKAAPRNAAARRDAPIQHISPEEAVAHIQALLEAKQERVQQTPSWPDAGDAVSSRAGSAATSETEVSTGLPASAEGGAPINAPRDDLGKRGG